MRQHQRRGGVAGDHDDVGPVRGDQLADQRTTRATNAFLGRGAVGEEGVIGDIDEIGVRPRGDDLAKDGQPAEAGIKDQNGRSCGHAAEILWQVGYQRVDLCFHVQGWSQCSATRRQGEPRRRGRIAVIAAEF